MHAYALVGTATTGAKLKGGASSVVVEQYALAQHPVDVQAKTRIWYEVYGASWPKVYAKLVGSDTPIWGVSPSWTV